jgi:hypothetical protein
MNGRNNRTIGLIFRELIAGVQNLVLNETHLIQTELRRTAQLTRRRSIYMLTSLSLLTIGILPFVSFLILGIGQILGDRYILSSLIVSLLFWLLGGGLTLYFAKKIQKQNFSLPNSRESLQKEALLLFQKGNRHLNQKPLHQSSVRKEKAS